jgi:hypothetical protein
VSLAGGYPYRDVFTQACAQLCTATHVVGWGVPKPPELALVYKTYSQGEVRRRGPRPHDASDTFRPSADENEWACLHRATLHSPARFLRQKSGLNAGFQLIGEKSGLAEAAQEFLISLL